MILVVAGTRPEAIKLATTVRDLRAVGLAVVYLWTGQHASDDMAGATAAHPSWPRPHAALEWAEDAPARIVAWWEARYPAPPAAVLVQGDTRSALAGALASAVWPDTALVHLEAGLRSWLREQVEERIRREIDRRADLLLCPSPLAAAFAAVDAGTDAEVVVTGQTGCDALLEVAALPLPELPDDLDAALRDSERWALLTLHRAELVDDPTRLAAVAVALVEAATTSGLRPVWALHPRVRQRATVEAAFAGILRAAAGAGARLVDPVPYRAMAALLSSDGRPTAVLTDSGGLVEEAYLFGIPTLVVRDATERWEAVTEGVAALLRPEDAPRKAAAALAGLLACAGAPTGYRVAWGRASSRAVPFRPTARVVAAITRYLARTGSPEAA